MQNDIDTQLMTFWSHTKKVNFFETEEMASEKSVDRLIDFESKIHLKIHHEDHDILMRVQNLDDQQMHALRFSEEEKNGDYKITVLDEILGSSADLKAKKFTEKNLLNTRTRSEVL